MGLLTLRTCLNDYWVYRDEAWIEDGFSLVRVVVRKLRKE